MEYSKVYRITLGNEKGLTVGLAFWRVQERPEERDRIYFMAVGVLYRMSEQEGL